MPDLAKEVSPITFRAPSGARRARGRPPKASAGCAGRNSARASGRVADIADMLAWRQTVPRVPNANASMSAPMRSSRSRSASRWASSTSPVAAGVTPRSCRCSRAAETRLQFGDAPAGDRYGDALALGGLRHAALLHRGVEASQADRVEPVKGDRSVVSRAGRPLPPCSAA